MNLPYLIAEMSANHAGDLDLALKTVEAAARSGANCLKVQTYTADSLTLDSDQQDFIIKNGLWKGRRLYDLYTEASMPWEWHQPIKRKCDDLGIDFLSTPFDSKGVDFLDELGVNAYKIASFELVDIPLIKYAASKKKRMIVSTGMGTMSEIEDAVLAIRSVGNDDICLLHCVSEYPANHEDMNLANIPDMAKKFGVEVGFSDHSMGYEADVVAAALGACIIEKHFCLDRNIDSADASFSMTPDEFASMVDAVKRATSSVGTPIYGPKESEISNVLFRRSLYACKDIEHGEIFTNENIRVVRPGYGMAPKYYDKILGKSSSRNYSFGDPIREDIPIE